MSSTKGQTLPAVLWSHGKPIASSGHRDVNLAISRRATFLKSVRVPNASKAEVAQVLAVQLPSHFPAAAGELAFDFRLTQDVTGEGRVAVVSAVRTAQLREAIAEAQAAGLRPVTVVPEALGSQELAASLGKPDAAVVEATPEGLAIDIVQGGELRYSRLAPVPRSEAEIEAEVCRTYSIAGLSVAPTIAAGGLKLESADAKTNSRPIDFLSHADRLGIHLEIPEVRARRERAKQQTKVRLFAVLATTALVLAGLLAFDSAQANADRQAAETRWRGRISKQKRATAAATTEQREQVAVSKTLERAFQPAQRVQDISTLVANLAPKSIWLTGMTVERGRRVTIRGTATNGEAVSGYLQALSAQERFRDVKLELASNMMIQETPVVQFAVSLHAVGNLPLVEKETKRRR